MNTRFHDGTIYGCNDFERFRRLARDNFRDGFEAVNMIAGIDAFGRIANGEIGACLQA